VVNTAIVKPATPVAANGGAGYGRDVVGVVCAAGLGVGLARVFYILKITLTRPIGTVSYLQFGRAVPQPFDNLLNFEGTAVKLKRDTVAVSSARRPGGCPTATRLAGNSCKIENRQCLQRGHSTAS
jgi:hypothetical protein